VTGARIFALPLTKESAGGELALSAGKFRIGDTFRFTARGPAGTQAYVVEQWPDGSFVQRLPNALQQQNALGGNGEITVPPAGQGGENLSGLTGTRRIRLALFPAGLTPAELNDSNAGRVIVVEKSYDVEE